MSNGAFKDPYKEILEISKKQKDTLKNDDLKNKDKKVKK